MTFARTDLYVPRPAMNAAAKLPAVEAGPTPSLSLSQEEAAERAQLQAALRTRRSVDNLARAWYGGIGALVLSGLAGRAYLEASSRWLLGTFAVAALLLWTVALRSGLRALRLSREEQAKLARLGELDARAPKAPELF